MESLEVENFFRLAQSTERENILIAVDMFSWAHKSLPLVRELLAKYYMNKRFFDELYPKFCNADMGRIALVFMSQDAFPISFHGQSAYYESPHTQKLHETYILQIDEDNYLEVPYINRRLEDKPRIINSKEKNRKYGNK